MTKKKIVILGDLIYDCIIWADRLPKMGETVSGTASGFFSGGKGANQAVEAARLGAQVFMIGKVGKDERGDFLRASLKKEKINTDHLMTSDEYATSTCCIHVDKNGNNAIIVAPQANEHISAEEIQNCRDLISSADIFITQMQVNEEAISAAVQIASDAGVPIVLNPAPAKKGLESLFEKVDYITPNETEAEFYAGLPAKKENLNRVAAYFHNKGVKNVIMTLGSKGAYYSAEGVCGIAPAFHVQAVDSTAAGDAFNAAFSIAIASGSGLLEAIRYGNAAGALAATKRGSQVSLPTGQEVEQFLKNN